MRILVRSPTSPPASVFTPSLNTLSDRVPRHPQVSSLPPSTPCQIAYLATRKCCAGPGAVALDVGGNMGYYSVYLAAVGCRVLAWEVQPEMLAYFR